MSVASVLCKPLSHLICIALMYCKLSTRTINTMYIGICILNINLHHKSNITSSHHYAHVFPKSFLANLQPLIPTLPYSLPIPVLPQIHLHLSLTPVGFPRWMGTIPVNAVFMVSR